MAETSSTSPTTVSSRSRTPLWVIEGLDVVHLRASVLKVAIGAACVLGVVLAVVAPGLLPPTPLVGAAVAVAAILLGLAVALAVDAVDLTIRGPRHVRAAGGELVSILPATGGASDIDDLARAVLEAREPDAKLLLGLAASGTDALPTSDWTDALALALARRGVSVLRVDLTTGGSDRPGLYEVLRHGAKLVSAVDFETDIQLARMGPGRDHSGALAALPEFPSRLPRDLQVLLVALPLAASRASVNAARALDHVLVVAERDVTSRVQLIAALDALEAAGTRAQVVLLDTRTARRLGVGASPAAPAAPAHEPEPQILPEPFARPEPPPQPEPQAQPERQDVEPAPEPESREQPHEPLPDLGPPMPEPADPTVAMPTPDLAPEPPEPVPDIAAEQREPTRDADDHVDALDEEPSVEPEPEADADALAEERPAAIDDDSDVVESAEVADDADANDEPARYDAPTGTPERTTEMAADEGEPAAAWPAEPEPSEPVTARDLDVVLGAAAAAAASETDLEPDAPPLDTADAADEAPHTEPDDAPGLAGDREPEPAERAGEPDDDDPASEDEHDTDRLPRLRSLRPVREAEPESDELRRTAQLATLMDELEARRRDA